MIYVQIICIYKRMSRLIISNKQMYVSFVKAINDRKISISYLKIMYKCTRDKVFYHMSKPTTGKCLFHNAMLTPKGKWKLHMGRSRQQASVYTLCYFFLPTKVYTIGQGQQQNTKVYNIVHFNYKRQVSMPYVKRNNKRFRRVDIPYIKFKNNRLTSILYFICDTRFLIVRIQQQKTIIYTICQVKL